jgi:hypothetical protein
MRKRKYLVLTLALLSLAILGFTADGYDVGLANAPSSASTQNIPTLGTISYPTFNATPNLALIPDDWGLAYGNGPQIIHLDYSVTHNGDVSIRLDPHTGNDVNTARECDGTWYDVNVGDHIVAKCWIKVGNLSGYPGLDVNNYLTWRGGRIGFDFYGSNGRISGFESASLPETDDTARDNFVVWNTTGWVQKTIDFYVPSTYKDDFDNNYWTPTSIVMWMQGMSPTDNASVWFSGAELYINP